MKIEVEHIAAALALLALGYMLGKRRAAAGAEESATQPQASNNPAQWWTYAGGWV